MNSKSEPKKQQNNELDFAQLRKESRLSVFDTPKYPPVAIKIEDSIVGTLGNFSASTGKAKSRKTFNISALAASVLSNDTVLNYTCQLPQEKRKLIYIDTEQSKFHSKKVLDRIIKLAGLTLEKEPENLEFLALRPFGPKERIGIIEHTLYNTPNLGFVIIDGIRDLAFDINSPQEATELITKLMRWTEELNIHLHTVLHQNKGDTNSRGHLGTELNNKAESIITVTKDESNPDISIVDSEMLRDKDFESFAFSINEDSLPFIVADYVAEKPKQKNGFTYEEVPEKTHMEVMSEIFINSNGLNYKTLIENIKDRYTAKGYNMGYNKAKSCKTFLENKRIIIKEGALYILNPQGHY